MISHKTPRNEESGWRLIKWPFGSFSADEPVQSEGKLIRYLSPCLAFCTRGDFDLIDGITGRKINVKGPACIRIPVLHPHHIFCDSHSQVMILFPIIFSETKRLVYVLQGETSVPVLYRAEPGDSIDWVGAYGKSPDIVQILREWRYFIRNVKRPLAKYRNSEFYEIISKYPIPQNARDLVRKIGRKKSGPKGISFTKSIKERLIYASAWLLMDGKTPGDVVRLLNFKSDSSLRLQWYNFFGASPKEWKKQQMKNIKDIYLRNNFAWTLHRNS